MHLIYLDGKLVPAYGSLAIHADIRPGHGYAEVKILVDYSGFGSKGISRMVESLELLDYKDGVLQARYAYDPAKADYKAFNDGLERYVLYTLRPVHGG